MPIQTASLLDVSTDITVKVTYDLHQVDSKNLPHLRDTLVTALERYQSGPRTIIVQICLALSSLALQLPSWNDVVKSMIDSFGRNPATVPALLHFLTVLPEELGSNTKIPITVRFQQLLVFLASSNVQDEEHTERSTRILTDNSKTLLELLSMYIQASGASSSFQSCHPP